MNMTPIKTPFNGCMMRSRLEARWATWLHTLRIRWRYELQGFAFRDDGKTYLPDFWLPHPSKGFVKDGVPPVKGFYLEVKPYDPTDETKDLILSFATHSKHCAILFAGDPHEGEFSIYFATPGQDVTHYPAEKCWLFLAKILGYLLSEENVPGPSLLTAAFCAARSAQFEYGEEPKIPVLADRIMEGLIKNGREKTP